MAKNLTKKQQVFVAEYLTDMNATRAAIAAGYSRNGAEVTGSQLLRNPKVSEEIEKKTQKRLEKLELSADYVLKNIIEVGERCLQKRWPVMIGKAKILTEFVEDPETGEEVEAQVYEFNALGALKAQELLGKHLKLFTDKVEHSGDVKITTLTDEERAAKIAAILNAAKSRKNAK